MKTKGKCRCELVCLCSADVGPVGCNKKGNWGNLTKNTMRVLWSGGDRRASAIDPGNALVISYRSRIIESIRVLSSTKRLSSGTGRSPAVLFPANTIMLMIDSVNVFSLASIIMERNNIASTITTLTCPLNEYRQRLAYNIDSATAALQAWSKAATTAASTRLVRTT
ncbi:hypothetical protein THIOKS12210002 [Thiocapsa sp. KS1]|nr:hypothetical protein THIOKS12210002 [Thiocapsa sp. KS1]